MPWWRSYRWNRQACRPGKMAGLRQNWNGQYCQNRPEGFSESDYVASFIGGAPAEDPKVVVLVSIRKPNKKLGKGYTGGTVASPVVGKILEKTLTYLEKQNNNHTAISRWGTLLYKIVFHKFQFRHNTKTSSNLLLSWPIFSITVMVGIKPFMLDTLPLNGWHQTITTSAPEPH